jgi:hypothetical protein
VWEKKETFDFERKTKRSVEKAQKCSAQRKLLAFWHVSFEALLQVGWIALWNIYHFIRFSPGAPD